MEKRRAVIENVGSYRWLEGIEAFNGEAFEVGKGEVRIDLRVGIRLRLGRLRGSINLD